MKKISFISLSGHLPAVPMDDKIKPVLDILKEGIIIDTLQKNVQETKKMGSEKVTLPNGSVLDTTHIRSSSRRNGFGRDQK